MEVVRWFPLDQFGTLESAISSELSRSRRARRRDAIAVALGLHGLRVGEIVRAERRDFFAAAKSLDVPPFKRGRARKIPLHHTLVAALQAELASRTVQSPLLLCSRTGGRCCHKQFQQLANEIFSRLLGASHGLCFHSLRHTFAMRLYAETKDLFLVQRYLGHRSVTSTEVYARSLAEIPDACLVKLCVGGGLTVAPQQLPGAQLKLFSD